MDTHLLHGEKLPLDTAIEAGNIWGIRNSDEPVQRAHLVAVLERRQSHLLEAVVGKLLGQKNGLSIIEEAATFARNMGQAEIARRLDNAVERNREEAHRPGQKRGSQLVAAHSAG